MKKILFLLVITLSLVLALGSSTTYAYIGDFVEPTESTLSHPDVIQLTNESRIYQGTLENYYLYYAAEYTLDDAYDQSKVKLITDFTDAYTVDYYVSMPTASVGDLFYTFTTAENMDLVSTELLSDYTITVTHDGTVSGWNVEDLEITFYADGRFEMATVDDEDPASGISSIYDHTLYLVPKTLLFSQQEKYDDVQEITDQFTFETTYSGRVLLTIESAIASTGWYYVELLNPTQKVDFTVINDYNTDFIRNFKEHFEDGDIAPYMISFEYYFDAESPDVITLTGPSIDNTVPDDIHIFNGVPGQGVTQQPSTGAGIITADSDTYQLFGIDWYWYAVAAAGAYILLSNKKFRKAVGLK
jgi:hypothetical protein